MHNTHTLNTRLVHIQNKHKVSVLRPYSGGDRHFLLSSFFSFHSSSSQGNMLCIRNTLSPTFCCHFFFSLLPSLLFFISNTQRQGGCIIHIPSASRAPLGVCLCICVCLCESVHVCVCAATITSHPKMQSGKNGSSKYTCVPVHLCLYTDINLAWSWELPLAHFAVCFFTWLGVKRSERG